MADEEVVKDGPDTCRSPFDTRARPHYFHWLYDEATKQTSMTHVQCSTCGIVRLNNRDYAAPTA
jgi:hypothetical protein